MQEDAPDHVGVNSVLVSKDFTQEGKQVVIILRTIMGCSDVSLVSNYRVTQQMYV